jgi:hypothetical protein
VIWPWISSAWGGLDDEIRVQQQVVDRAAEAVGEARADGTRREIADRLADYRAAAATLEQLQQARAPSADALALARRRAVTTLRDALAEGRREADEARQVLLTWLGEPAQRTVVLEQAFATAKATGGPPALRRAILLDVVEQGDALAALLAFDATVQEIEADQLELRALSLRRRGPGQTPTMLDEVEAVRLLAEAERHDRAEDELRALRARVLTLVDAATSALAEESP